MIELRRAKPEERGAVAALWNRVFGDDEGFLAEFYRLCVPADEMLVLAEEGTVRSILCAPEMELRFPNGRGLKSGYLYALATDPAARGKGCGRQLARYCEEILKGRGADCAILVPAEPSLFDFFGGLDYRPAFSHLLREVTAAERAMDTGAGGMSPAGPEEYNALRRRWLAGHCYADCGDELVAFQQYLSQSLGGDIYRLELPGGPGCAAVERDGADTIVKELLCAPGDLSLAAGLLAGRYPGGACRLRLPPWTEGEGQRVRWGALRWLYGHPSPWWPGDEEGWLGLAFD